MSCCALSGQPSAACAEFERCEAAGASPGPRELLAVAVAFARAAETSAALGAWAELDARFGADADARTTFLDALVGDERGVVAAAKLMERGWAAADVWDADFTDDDEAEAQRVRAALATRVGTARNWAVAAAPDVSPKTRAVVSETTFARLAAALLRRGACADARAAISTLTKRGVMPSGDVRAYFDGTAGAGRGRQLYRTLFADDAPDGAEAWFDDLPNRKVHVDVSRDKANARRLVATTRERGERGAWSN